MFGCVSITIEAAIETGVVGADVYTFNTATNVSLIFDLSVRKSGSL